MPREIFKIGLLADAENQEQLAERHCRDAFSRQGINVVAIYEIRDVSTEAHHQAGERLYRLEVETDRKPPTIIPEDPLRNINRKTAELIGNDHGSTGNKG